MKMILLFLMILVISLFFIQLPLSPLLNNDSNYTTFKWFSFKKVSTLYVDDNKDFSTPIIKEVYGNEYKLNLEPGKYYWKLDHSFPIGFNINSKVSVKQLNNILTNDGNAKIKVSNKLTTFAILNPGESEKIEGVKNVTVEQA